MIRFICILLLTVTAVTISGCAIKVQGQKSYLLEVQRPDGIIQQPCGASIRVARFDSSKPYDSKWLIYRKDGPQFETDYYNHFLVSPDQAIQDQTRQWLLSSSAWSSVLRWDDSAEVQYELRGCVKKLYGDFRDKNEFKAVVEMEFVLVEKATGRFVLDEIYSSDKTFKEKTSNALVGAYASGIEDVLTRLEADLLLVVKE